MKFLRLSLLVEPPKLTLNIISSSTIFDAFKSNGTFALRKINKLNYDTDNSIDLKKK